MVFFPVSIYYALFVDIFNMIETSGSAKIATLQKCKVML